MLNCQTWIFYSEHNYWMLRPTADDADNLSLNFILKKKDKNLLSANSNHLATNQFANKTFFLRQTENASRFMVCFLYFSVRAFSKSWAPNIQWLHSKAPNPLFLLNEFLSAGLPAPLKHAGEGLFDGRGQNRGISNWWCQARAAFASASTCWPYLLGAHASCSSRHATTCDEVAWPPALVSTCVSLLACSPSAQTSDVVVPACACTPGKRVLTWVCVTGFPRTWALIWIVPVGGHVSDGCWTSPPFLFFKSF